MICLQGSTDDMVDCGNRNAFMLTLHTINSINEPYATNMELQWHA